MKKSSDNPQFSQAEKKWHSRKLVFALVAFFIGASSVFAVKVYDIMAEVMYEQNPPYDVKGRYLLAYWLRGIRVLSIDKETGTEAFWAAPFKWLHKQVYESGIKDIPEEDGERVIWRMSYKNLPLTYIKDKRVVKLMPEIINDFDELTSKPIASDRIRNIEQYIFADAHMNFYFKYKHFVPMPSEKRRQWERMLIDRSMGLIKEVELENYLDSKSVRVQMVPLDYAFFLYKVVVQRMLNKAAMRKAGKTKKVILICSVPEVGYAVYLDNAIKQHIKIYQGNLLKVKQKSLVKEFNSGWLFIHNHIRQPLKEQCNIIL